MKIKCEMMDPRPVTEICSKSVCSPPTLVTAAVCFKLSFDWVRFYRDVESGSQCLNKGLDVGKQTKVVLETPTGNRGKGQADGLSRISLQFYQGTKGAAINSGVITNS